MRKTFYSKALFLILGAFLSLSAGAQVLITSTPDSTAILNETYSYDVDVITIPPGAPITYTLEEKPSGMTINSSTGLISWTPTSIFQGGKVVVKATKSVTETSTQTYYVYVTDAIECLPDISTYLNMDVKIEKTLPDMAGSNDAEYVGVETNEPIMTPGKVGNALRFNPQSKSDIFYEIPDQNQYEWIYDTAFSFTFWFKNRNTSLDPAPETILGRAASESNPASWALQWVNTSKKMGLFMQASDGSDTIVWCTGVVSDTNWHHFAVVIKASRMGSTKFMTYYDKVKFTSYKDYGVTKFDNTTPVTVGYWAQYPSNTYPLSGYLDEVAIFNRELTDAQIAQLYNKGINGTPVCQEGNFTPIITSSPVTLVDEDSDYSYTLKARDYETAALTKTVVAKPDWLEFDASTGVLSGTPNNDDAGDHTVTLRVSDGLTNVEQTFTINVANVNDAPVINSTPALAVNEDELYTYTLEASDIDASDNVTLSAVLKPSWLSFNATTGVLSGTPTNAVLGTNPVVDFDVTLRATDESGAYDEQSFKIRVTNINDTPVINSQNAISTEEDVPVLISLDDLNVTDVDDIYPTDFTLTVKAGQNYTFSGNTVTPAENWNGTLSVPVDLSDGSATVSYTLSVEVIPVDDAPVFTSTPVLTVTAGNNYQYWIATDDAEDQDLTITATGLPSWLNLAANGATALLSGTPANADAGEVEIVLNVTDGTTDVEQPFTLTVDFNTPAQVAEVELAKVYPVPASEFVNFNFIERLDQASLEIFSNNGILLRKIDVSGLNNYQLKVSDMKPNYYIFRLTTPGRIHNGNFVVE